MSTSVNELNNMSQTKLNLNLHNIEPNSLISLSFNFDILKYVITELINNQKNLNIELSKIKSELLQEKKHSNEIEFSLVELKLSSEKNDDEIQKRLENQKIKLNHQLKELENQIKISENKSLLEFRKSINLGRDINNINNEINKENKINNDNSSNENENSDNIKGVKSEEIQTIINDIENIKSKHLEYEKDLNKYKTEIDKIIDKKINDSTIDIENNFSSKFKKLETKLSEQILKNKDDIASIKKVLEKNNKEIQNNLNEINNNKIPQLKGKIEIITPKISEIYNNFSLYTKNDEFKQNKESTNEYIKNTKEDLNKNIELLRRGFNSIKDQFLEHINNKNDHNSLLSLLERFCTIETLVSELKDFQKIIEEKERRRFNVNPNDIINKNTFEKFVKNLNKDFDEYKKHYQNIKKDLDELITKESGNKASLKDLKKLEDNIMMKIEDLKESLSIKFVDKNLLNRNKKLIEIQTKKLIEENKKEGMKDGWILAKKPLDGHLCASCDSFIGDLNSNATDKYIPWNKYPQKETPDRVYKIDGGISNLINLFNNKFSNLNNNYKTNINNTSFDNSSNNDIKIEDNDEINKSRNSLKEKSSNDKNIQVKSFTSRLHNKKNFKIKGDEDLLNLNITNLPILPKTIKNIQKNKSSISLFSSSNIKTKSFQGIIKNMKLNNAYKNINLSKNNKQIEEDEDLYPHIKKHVLPVQDKEKTEPQIIKIIKKH